MFYVSSKFQLAINIYYLFEGSIVHITAYIRNMFYISSKFQLAVQHYRSVWKLRVWFLYFLQNYWNYSQNCFYFSVIQMQLSHISFNCSKTFIKIFFINLIIIREWNVNVCIIMILFTTTKAFLVTEVYRTILPAFLVRSPSNHILYVWWVLHSRSLTSNELIISRQLWAVFWEY